MANVDKSLKTYLGMDTAELGALAVGGALVPVMNGLVSKYAPTVATQITNIFGAQAAGSILPILIGAGLNAASEHVLKGKPAAEYLEKAGEGLVAAGIIGLTMSMSQKYVNPALGLSGVNYTPRSLSGVNYTPRAMNGMGIVPQLAGPDFGAPNYGSGGYTEQHRFSNADFGGVNYTPNAMSGFAMEEDIDETLTDDDIQDTSMGGGMG